MKSVGIAFYKQSIPRENTAFSMFWKIKVVVMCPNTFFYLFYIYCGINNLTLIAGDNIRKMESLGIKGIAPSALQIYHNLVSSLDKKSSKTANG